MSDASREPRYITRALLERVRKAKHEPKEPFEILGRAVNRLSPGEDFLYSLPVGVQRLLHWVSPENQSMQKVIKVTNYRLEHGLV